MLRAKTAGAVALLGLLAGATAQAGDWQSQPQIRVGIDLLWGGYGYVPPPPPVAWYPSHFVPYRYSDERPDRGHDRGHDRGKGRDEWRRNGHHQDHHRSHRGRDCDD